MSGVGHGAAIALEHDDLLAGLAAGEQDRLFRHHDDVGDDIFSQPGSLLKGG